MTYVTTTRELLAATIVCIDEYGWLSRKECYANGGTSTADKALNLIYSLAQNPSADITTKLNAAASDVEDILDWIDNMVADSDYLKKVQAICSNEKLHRNQIATAASAVVAFRKENAYIERRKLEAERQEKSREENKDAGWVGQPGDKFGRALSKKDKDAGATAHPAIEGELIFKKPLDLSTLLKFKDAEGNIWVWFSSGSAEAEVGKTYQIIGTLKRHDEYRGIKNNLLSRCAIEEIVTT